MEPRHVLAVLMRPHVFRRDPIEIEGRRVHEPRPGWAPGQDLRRHDGAGIEADGAALDERASAHGDEIGSAGACPDEMNGHGPVSRRARAQVAEAEAMRSRMSRAPGPAAPRAAASATEP